MSDQPYRSDTPPSNQTSDAKNKPIQPNDTRELGTFSAAKRKHTHAKSIKSEATVNMG